MQGVVQVGGDLMLKVCVAGDWPPLLTPGWCWW